MWVDVFAHSKSNTIWLTILQASVPLGIVIGYCMTAVLDAHGGWRLSYYIQTGLYILMFFILLIVKRKYVEEEDKDDKLEGSETDSEDYTSNDEASYMSDSDDNK